ncbi:hypothetical protein ROHU_014397 [Labeo rohita]|uniref:Ig-like domain-containing protein n=1 Tax=Labeo rohita TaxID=84645 RepID=A0A498NTX6_LABRO|nr:hypothetical protein ROHU_014397 [Labeo rohita]
MKDCDLYNNRPEVTVINGTLIIKRVIRADSGNYTLKLSPSDGTETSRDLQVIVEAPIGSVEVSISCSSSGVMRASCSSEGDQLLYNWTLNGDPLIDGNRSIDLDEETDGNISCSVKNHVSHGQKTIRVKPCPGLELNCSFNQSDSCYAALGHKLKLPMVLDASKYDLQLKKRINNNTAHDLVCRVKNDKMRECDLYNNRAEVTVINGTLIINHVTKADSGNYTLTLSHSDGTELFQGNLQVIVEAPIGSVEVSISCSSSGVMRASCSSEGDQLLYSWTLNGDPLMVGNSSIDLDERTDGNICCSVKNHVSHGQKTIRVKPCPATAGNVELIYADISHENKCEKKKTGLDRFCWFDQSDLCYAALGHKLSLPMLLGASEYDMKISPIGSVEVSISCSSSGVMRASCSSEGDQLLYSWTLNGDPLMVGNSSIDLDERTDGNICCSVKNHVSHGQKTIRVKPCPVSVVFVLVWCFQLMVLLGLLGGFHIYMRHTSGKKREDQKFSGSSVRVRSDCVTEAASNSSAGFGLFWKLEFREMMLIFGLMLLLQTDASPIGSVEVSIICSSSGVMRASCSSEGDQLLYSWTLNGDPLMDGNSSIDLNEGTDGNICCSVKNHVSHGQKTIRVKPCPGLDRFCRFDQSDPCYAALGHKLNLLMVLDTSEYDLKIRKRTNNTQDDPLCRVKYGRMRMKECDLYNNRTEVTVINGTLIINHVIRADSGNYTLRLSHSDGTETSRDLQVIVEEPTTAPVTSSLTSTVSSTTQTSDYDVGNDQHDMSVMTNIRKNSILITLVSTDACQSGSSVRVRSDCVTEAASHSSAGFGLWKLDFTEMMLIFGLMLLLQTDAYLDRFCGFDQSAPCYTALGDKLNLLMVLDTSEYDLKIQKRINDTHDDSVCRIKNNIIKQKECDLYNNRAEVTVINGILIIKHVIRADSGNYRLTLDLLGGTETSKYLHVNVEAPFGSVEVSISCSSNQTSVRCSSEGDQIIYSWTLNGKILEQGLMDGKTSIQLSEGTDGNISCSVKNHISHAQKTIRVKPCPVSVVFVLVWCFQLMVLLGLLGGFHIYMRHTSGLDRFCRFDQSDLCYAALGHKLNLLMVLDTSEYDLRADSGNYRITLSHSDGTETSRDLQVIVEAPIGSVEVSISCFFNQRSVSCSSEGDQITYIWNLNGEILKHGLMAGNSRIDLDEGADGNISCSVKNHISHAQKTIRVEPCPGLDRFCRFGQSDHCYAALGHKLNLLMVLDTSEYDLQIIKRINNTQDDPLCGVKYDRMKDCDLYNNRAEVSVINGTLIINHVIRADSGNYRLRLDHSDGTETSRDLQVIVEAPIGPVNVSISCSFNQRSVSCSSEGDQIIYSWTLNGIILEQGPMVRNTTIQLNEGTDGNISCSVKNNVSHAQKTIRVEPCPGLDRFCWFKQSDPCNAALGHKLNLLVVLDNKNDELKIQKKSSTDNNPFCSVKNGRMIKHECDLYNNRPEVTVINGILVINHVIRADSGKYRLTRYHSDGSETFQGDLQVFVEAPIGSVEVSIICSSSGVMRVSCSSEGDQLLYNWTLNGDPLMDGNSSIELDEGTDGNISCSVKNHVSHGQKTIRVKPCPGLDRFCRFGQSDLCYAALGHKLNLLMVLDTSEYDLQIIKRINNNTIHDLVCRVKYGRMKECDLYNYRPEVTVINRTLIIKRVIRADYNSFIQAAQKHLEIFK